MFRGYFSFQGGVNQDVGYLLFLNVKKYKQNIPVPQKSNMVNNFTISSKHTASNH